MSYGNMAENTLPDQINGIRRSLHSSTLIWILPVSGIQGSCSGGGFATAAAMFRYPDFFKVGIFESGNHENRNYEDDWGERYNGLDLMPLIMQHRHNQLYAKNLKAELVLGGNGLMDDNVLQ